jgi:hypothetical protein
MALTTNMYLASRYQMALRAFMVFHRENFIVTVFGDLINKLYK